MSRNPNTCPHNITDEEAGEIYCTECGEVLGDVKSRADMLEAMQVDDYQQDERNW